MRGQGSARGEPSPPSWGRVHRGTLPLDGPSSAATPLASLVGASSSRRREHARPEPPPDPRLPRGGEFIEAPQRECRRSLSAVPRLPRGGEFIEATCRRPRPLGSPCPRLPRGGEFIEARSLRRQDRPSRPSPPSWGRVHRGFITSIVSWEREVPRLPRGGEFIEAYSTVRSECRNPPPRLPRGGEFIEASKCGVALIVDGALASLVGASSSRLAWPRHPCQSRRPPSPPSWGRVHRGTLLVCKTCGEQEPSPPSWGRVHRGVNCPPARGCPGALASLVGASSSRPLQEEDQLAVDLPSPPSWGRVHRGFITSIVSWLRLVPRLPRGGEFIEAQGSRRVARPRAPRLPRGGEFIEAPPPARAPHGRHRPRLCEV